METMQNDPLDLFSIIKEALPIALVKHSENFDDISYGWEICPDPGFIIHFSVEMDNPLNIKLDKYIIPYPWSGTPKVKRMFFGTIPPTEEMEPDFNFVKQLLKNWRAIG